MSNQAKIWKATLSVFLILILSLSIYLSVTDDSKIVSATVNPPKYTQVTPVTVDSFKPIQATPTAGPCQTHTGTLSYPADFDGNWYGCSTPACLGFVSCPGQCNYGNGKHCGGGFNSGVILRATWNAQSGNTAWCAAFSPGSCKCIMCKEALP